MIELTETTSSAISAAFIEERRHNGSPAMGMVMTMVIVVDEEHSEQALTDARHASHEHPARVLGVILGDGRGKGRVDARIGVGSQWSGEVALITLTGEVVKHADSVVSPLLLPDSPVVVWWPGDHPDEPSEDAIGRLATRRITDAASGRTLRRLCSSYAPGTTDLAWTRLTPWRALLATAFDQQPLRTRSAVVTAERVSPSADLLVAWLQDRLKVPVERKHSDGPGITSTLLETRQGEVEIVRTDGRLATFRSPGNPDRPMALKRRSIAELLSEELRRLDEDDVYARVAKRLVDEEGKGGSAGSPGSRTGKARTTTKKASSR